MTAARIILVVIGLGVACAGEDLRVAGLDTSVLGPMVRRQIDEAVAASRRQPDSAEALGRLGMTLHAYQLHEAAAEAYGRAAALDAEPFRWLYYRGRALASAGHPREAQSALTEAIRMRPEYVPARLAIGDLLLESGDLEAAHDHFRAAAALAPASPEALHGLGRVLASLGREEEAIAAHQRAISLAPEHGAAHYALGLLHRDRGEEERAAHHLERSRQQHGRGPAVRDPLMAAVAELDRGPQGLERRAVELRRQGRTEAAIEVLLAAVRQDPQFLPARVHLIRLYGDIGRHQAVDEHYRAAIGINPNAQEARLGYARSLIDRGRLEEAHRELEQVVAVNPNHADAQVLLGSILDDRGEPREAERHYRRALETRPGHPQANLMMARHRLQGGRPEEAAEHARRLLASESESLPVLVYRLGLYYHQAGRSAEAAEMLGRARRLAAEAGRQRLVEEIDGLQERWRRGSPPEGSRR